MKQIPWYLADPQLREEVVSQTADHLLGMTLREDGPRLVAEGAFQVMSGPPPALDEFHVSVDFGPSFPTKFPSVREIGGRIEKIKDRHVNEVDGTLCLEVPEVLWHKLGSPRNVSGLLGVALNDFCLQQIYFEVHKKFLHEWPHEGAGRFAYYFERLPDANGNLKILDACLKVALGPRIPSRDRCPICKGPRLARCHRDKLVKLKQEVRPELMREIRAMIGHMSR